MNNSEFLKINEAKENEITYNHRDVVQIAKENVNKAKKLLKDNPEFVEELNAVKDSKDGIKQFLKTEQQRDLLVSAYILARNKNEVPSQSVGLELNDPDQFKKYCKIIVDRTRKAANLLDKENPSVEEVKKLRDEEFDPEAAQKMKEPQKEEPSDKSPEEDSSEEEVDSSFPPQDEDDDEEDDEAEPEEEEKDSSSEDSGEKKEKSVISKDWESPKEIAKKIESTKETFVKKVDDFLSKFENPEKEKTAAADKAKDRIKKTLDSYIEKAEKKEKGFSMDPTRRSALKASSEAKKLYNDAVRESEKQLYKFKRSTQAGRVARTIGRAKEDINKVSSGVKKVANNRNVKATGEALKRAGKIGGAAASRAGKAASEFAGQKTTQVKQNIAANTIGKVLGQEKRKQYVDLLRDKKPEEADKLYQEAKKKKTGDKETSRMNRLEKGRVAKENTSIKNYINKKHLNELADNPASRENEKKGVSKQSDEVKIASTSMGEKGAEDYLKKMKGSVEEKEEAVKMLKKAQEEISQKQKELDQKAKQAKQNTEEVKERNSAVKRALSSLYS